MAEKLAIAIKMTDEELMKAVNDGDHTAYKTLVNSHIKSVSRCAYRILGNRNDAADIQSAAVAMPLATGFTPFPAT